MDRIPYYGYGDFSSILNGTTNLNKNAMRLLTCLLCAFLLSCAGPKDPNYLGYVRILPEGTYKIVNKGSRHIVYCYREDGKYYTLNDADFDLNGIPGYDAHQYRNLTTVEIRYERIN